MRSIFFLLTLFLVPFNVFAINYPTPTGSEELNLSLQKIPLQREEATIILSTNSSDVDLNSALINWRVDGERFLDNKIANIITVKTGGIGEPTRVAVDVASNGRLYQKELTILPIALSLLIESDTYVPDWYNGSPLSSDNSTISAEVFVRFLDLNRILYDEDDFVFNWEEGRSEIRVAKGLGVNTTKLEGPSVIDQAKEIVVSVEPKEDTPIFLEDIEIKSLVRYNEPKILTYQETDFYGAFIDNAIEKNSRLELSSNKKVFLRVFPFFTQGNELSYNWEINKRVFNTNDSVINFAPSESGRYSFGITTKTGIFDIEIENFFTINKL